MSEITLKSFAHKKVAVNWKDVNFSGIRMVSIVVSEHVSRMNSIWDSLIDLSLTHKAP
jgi:hypothetical protein